MSDKQVLSDDVRRKLRPFLDEVTRHGAHITIVRYGEPAAVLVPVEWHEQAGNLAAAMEAGIAAWAELRDGIKDLRAVHYDHANDLADEGKDAERAFGRVDAYDEVLKLMDRLEGQG